MALNLIHPHSFYERFKLSIYIYVCGLRKTKLCHTKINLQVKKRLPPFIENFIWTKMVHRVKMCYIVHWILYIQLKEIEQGNMDETEIFIAFHDIELSRVNYRILDGVAKIYGPYNIYAFWYKTNTKQNGYFYPKTRSSTSYFQCISLILNIKGCKY